MSYIFKQLFLYVIPVVFIILVSFLYYLVFYYLYLLDIYFFIIYFLYVYLRDFIFKRITEYILHRFSLVILGIQLNVNFLDLLLRLYLLERYPEVRNKCSREYFSISYNYLQDSLSRICLSNIFASWKLQKSQKEYNKKENK